MKVPTKNLFCILLFLLFSPKRVFPLGENGNFEELYQMVESKIKAAKSYVLPKDNSDKVKTDSDKIYDYGTYDFIIVGAGAAGSVIANRLTEISNWKVLLLEAGGPSEDFNKILGLSVYSYYSKFNWGYNTTTQKNACLGFENNQCFIVQGKGLGGGTIVNAAMYVRGHPEDFDRWDATYGNQGWSYQEVLPYFKKSENVVFTPANDFYRGKGGYYTIDHTNETPGLEPVLINGAKEQELDYLFDYNEAIQVGISKTQFALKGNERVTAGLAFLAPFMNRKNLNISINSFATKILIEGKRACGVQFIKNGKIFQAKAKKEVIMSAGTINSAQLLLLSGIGPRKHLKSSKINVVADLPVGQYLQDQVTFVGLFFRTNHSLYNYTLREQLKLYVEHKRPLTAGVDCEMVAFLNLEQNKTKKPDIEYMLSAPAFDSAIEKLSFRVNQEYEDVFNATVNTTSDIWVNPVLLHPQSRGSVTLKSNNPKDMPNIDPSFLSEESDIETLYKGVEFLIKLNSTEAFKQYGMQILVMDYPGCTDIPKLSKEWWICGIKHLSTTIYHPVSTNRMGPNPKTSVVNSRLQVHGIEKLRVADCSIMPESNSGHTHAVALMIGEKAADILKEDYGQLP